MGAGAGAGAGRPRRRQARGARGGRTGAGAQSGVMHAARAARRMTPDACDAQRGGRWQKGVHSATWEQRRRACARPPGPAGHGAPVAAHRGACVRWPPRAGARRQAAAHRQGGLLQPCSTQQAASSMQHAGMQACKQTSRRALPFRLASAAGGASQRPLPPPPSPCHHLQHLQSSLCRSPCPAALPMLLAGAARLSVI